MGFYLPVCMKLVSSQMYVNSQQQMFITRSNMIFSANSQMIYVNYCRGQVSILVDIKVQSPTLLFVLITLPDLMLIMQAQ